MLSMTFKIEDVIVSRDLSGQQNVCTDCAVARLVKRNIADVDWLKGLHVETGTNYTGLATDDSTIMWHAEHSPETRDFIRAFDCGLNSLVDRNTGKLCAIVWEREPGAIPRHAAVGERIVLNFKPGAPPDDGI